LSYEGVKSFLVENIKLSKPNKDYNLYFSNQNLYQWQSLQLFFQL